MGNKRRVSQRIFNKRPERGCGWGQWEGYIAGEDDADPRRAPSESGGEGGEEETAFPDEALGPDLQKPGAERGRDRCSP